MKKPTLRSLATVSSIIRHVFSIWVYEYLDKIFISKYVYIYSYLKLNVHKYRFENVPICLCSCKSNIMKNSHS